MFQSTAMASSSSSSASRRLDLERSRSSEAKAMNRRLSSLRRIREAALRSHRRRLDAKRVVREKNQQCESATATVQRFAVAARKTLEETVPAKLNSSDGASSSSMYSWLDVPGCILSPKKRVTPLDKKEEILKMLKRAVGPVAALSEPPQVPPDENNHDGNDEANASMSDDDGIESVVLDAGDVGGRMNMKGGLTIAMLNNFAGNDDVDNDDDVDDEYHHQEAAAAASPSSPSSDGFVVVPGQGAVEAFSLDETFDYDSIPPTSRFEDMMKMRSDNTLQYANNK